MYKIEKMDFVDRRPGRPYGEMTQLMRSIEVGEGFYAPLSKKTVLAPIASRLNKELHRRISVYKVDDECVQVVRREDPK